MSPIAKKIYMRARASSKFQNWMTRAHAYNFFFAMVDMQGRLIHFKNPLDDTIVCVIASSKRLPFLPRFSILICLWHGQQLLG